MIEVDGSAGGGQLVRSSVALSALTCEPVRIEGIRGARDDPGLQRQHLTAVEVAASVASADVEGAEMGSETLTFAPGEAAGDPPAGDGGSLDVEADVGTAGSVTLVFDAVLPLATQLDGHCSVTVRGGTDVKWSPPMDYYRRVKLPLLRAHGWGVAVDVERRGFYPAGGGEATLHLWPSDPEPLALGERVDAGAVDRVAVCSVESEQLADADVAARQARAAASRLGDAGIAVDVRAATTAESACPGSVIVLRATTDDGTVLGASALGEPGTPAETVGERAAERLLDARSADGAVDEHLADQLLLPLALGGGTVRAPGATEHVESSLDLLATFGYDLAVEEQDVEEHDGLVVSR